MLVLRCLFFRYGNKTETEKITTVTMFILVKPNVYILALTVTMFILVKPNVALSHDWPIIGEPQAS